MTLDDAELDLHARAIEAATAVLTRYWAEGTVPPNPELLAARMGIEVVLGQPEDDAAVTAVRDERGARVVLRASLHPSLRSGLLLRAIGHLSRPGTPEASDGVTDEFTRSFAWALRMPEQVLGSLRREGLSWREIDDHLGVDRNRATEQWGVYAALWRRYQRTDVGGTPPPPWRTSLKNTSYPGRSVQIDAELSSGVEAYLCRPPGPFRGLYNPEGVAAVAVHRSPDQLLDEVRSVVREMNRVPLAEARGDFVKEIDLVSAHVAAHRPELSREARSALVNRWAFANR